VRADVVQQLLLARPGPLIRELRVQDPVQHERVEPHLRSRIEQIERVVEVVPLPGMERFESTMWSKWLGELSFGNALKRREERPQ